MTFHSTTAWQHHLLCLSSNHQECTNPTKMKISFLPVRPEATLTTCFPTDTQYICQAFFQRMQSCLCGLNHDIYTCLVIFPHPSLSLQSRLVWSSGKTPFDIWVDAGLHELLFCWIFDQNWHQLSIMRSSWGRLAWLKCCIRLFTRHCHFWFRLLHNWLLWSHYSIKTID